ncbi:CHAT domain-containing protein [Streptomyces sp. TRM S81-3]|uniref:CHAT domain-containing protein n=1 Tax=Streptomyces griseicoloratus TaxID=2752516 RepID=A0A926L364_9ACTN|nr:CHAT domain-containing protein [Streptomyces griseicoloratus]MBD0419427.1 CHAT domain-containing protein [Streptomyces griseicoloratus]
MSELRERVVARLVTAQNARDPAALRDENAVADALALLREAAPSPDGQVDLDSVAAVFWTFWFRHQGTEDPDAAQNLMVVFGTFGFLCPRVPEEARLPDVLKEGFDPADPSHEARFAHLMSSAYADAVAGGPQQERAAALDAALAWSDTSFEYVRPDDHVGFVELAVHAHELHLARFRMAADPDALAAAARYGRAVCTRLATAGPDLFDPDAARTVAAAALRTVVDAARLLGTPRLPLVERLAAAAPQGALTPETAEGLRLLRLLDAQPLAWPGARDLHVGAVIADAGIAEHDAGRIACAVRRLRAALAGTPAGHPARPQVTAALGQALAAFARERDDEAAALEAMELLDSVGALDDELRDTLAVYRELEELSESDDPADLERLQPLFRRFAERIREHSARDGDPADIDVEVIGLSAGFDPDDSADERIARYRTALAALPADRPHRHAYVAVLAALTGLRAQALRGTAPARADLFAAESRELTEEAAAAAPDGFLAPDLLRRGLFEAALPVAVMAVTAGGGEGAGGPDDEEMRAMVERLTRLDDVRLDGPETLDADIETVRELFDGLDEDDTTVRPYLAAVLGGALSARSADRADLASLTEIVELLRYARSHADDLPADIHRMLAGALTVLSTVNFDAESAREAAALLASAAGAPGVPAAEGEPRPGDPALSETENAILSARTELHVALQNYLFGHEPAQLERARRIARRMRDLARAAPPGDGLPWYDLMGDAYVDLVETVGPGGGPRPDLGDAVVDQCRATLARCAAGHPMRPMVVMTLARALAQRALALRATDPERAGGLLAEAEELSRVLSEEMPGGSSVDVGAMMRTFLDLIGRGRLPEATTAPGAPPPPGTPDAQEGFLASVLASLQARLTGVADPGAWRDPAVPVWARAHGEIGAAAGALGRERPRVDLALDHLEAGVEAMAGITDRGSDQASAEHGLSTFEGDIRSIVELVLAHLIGRELAARLPARLAALGQALRAAAAGQGPPEPGALEEMVSELGALERTVEGPDVDRAAVLLERGRGLLLARRIEARADTGDLRAAHPALAAEFERLTEQLEARPETSAAGDAEWARLAGLRASNELDALVRRIRTRPGFEGFLRPLAAEDLRALAADGPVVVLNHGRRFCHALVVTHRSISALPLDAGADEVADTARRLRDAVDAINAQGTSRPSPLQLVAAGHTVRETLAWTWHKIVRPVLEPAGAADPVPRGGEWPRVWWVPTGAFSSLPLHAAQCTAPDCALGRCGAALDTVVSSYVPGLQTLAYARARARQRSVAGHGGAPGHGGALLVAAPEDDLPGVAAAAAHAAELLGAQEPLVGQAATREAVLAALHVASWAHFGCHAATDPTEPSGALLHLPSGEQVSVLEICRARPRSAQLAFLAACGTARTAERLTDEAIHITSSFLLAGFPTAVGTLWTIDSTHADHMTRDFYRRATAADAAGSAHALHDTVRQLRRRIPDRPHIWAAYVHAGA